MYLNFLRTFYQIYPTHSGSVYNLTGMILSVLFREVPNMLRAKYKSSRSGGSVEDLV